MLQPSIGCFDRLCDGQNRWQGLEWDSPLRLLAAQLVGNVLLFTLPDKKENIVSVLAELHTLQVWCAYIDCDAAKSAHSMRWQADMPHVPMPGHQLNEHDTMRLMFPGGLAPASL